MSDVLASLLGFAVGMAFVVVLYIIWKER